MNTEELKIDNEFATLIPPLTPDEYSRLEQNIVAEGCREAIVVWNDTIVDGHNRYKICKAHDIDFQTMQKSFASRDEAMLWMIQNQLGRRNLNDFQRVEIARKYEGVIKAQAEQRMLAGKADPMEKFPQGTTTDILGALAGVSGKTYEHATVVLDEAPVSVIEATRKKELSINAAYEVTKLSEDQQAEIAERIQQGEAAKSVISEVKSRNRKSEPETQTNTAQDVPKNIVAEVVHSETQQEPQTPSETIEDLTVQSDTEMLQSKPIEEYDERTTEQDDHYEEEQFPYDDYDYYEPEEDEECTRIDIFKTLNSYNIIYAVPTWEDEQSAEELLKLPVGRVADENCALLLWVNGSLMSEALKVIDKWGFTFRTIVFVWVKRTEDDEGRPKVYFDTTSNWTCEACEFCLLATTGTVQHVNDYVPQVIPCLMENDGRHPEIFKELTVQLLGDLPTLELFPNIYMFEREEQFITQHNGEYVEWDMAAPKWYLEQLAEDRRTEMIMDAL